MPVVPRFRFFLSIGDIVKDFCSLIRADMSDTYDVPAFERKLATHYGRSYCATFSSYRMGLYFYLKALNLEKGDEVLITPITIPDVVNIILLLDLKPVFVDMEEQYHSIDTGDMIEKTTPRTRCLLLTHLCGLVPSEGLIYKFAQDNNITVIEDVSQTYGVLVTNDSENFFKGDALIGSLSSGKVLMTYTGGFLATNDQEVVREIRQEVKQTLRAPPKSRFLYELIKNIKVTMATSWPIFPFVHLVLRAMTWLSPSLLSRLTSEAFSSQRDEEDYYFDHTPIRRKRVPLGWLTFMNSWQARVGIRMIDELRIKTKKRNRLGRSLLHQLSPSVTRYIPRGAFDMGFVFYHLPFKPPNTKVAKVSLLNEGMDNDGYGLPCCTELEIFNDLTVDCPNARSLKNGVSFIPLNEKLTETQINQMAIRLNRMFSE